MPVSRIDFPVDKLTAPQTEEEIQRKLAQERQAGRRLMIAAP